MKISFAHKSVFNSVSSGTIEELMYMRQVYKVHLKQQTLKNDDYSAIQPARIFRGVDKDKNRKGELFGLENLLKFKDGSFMEAMWKAADVPPPSADGMHTSSTMTDIFEKASTDQIENVLGDGLATLKTNEDKPSDPGKISDSDDHMKGFNHEDFLREDKGNAALLPGDEGFEDEMGIDSQMVDMACNLSKAANKGSSKDSANDARTGTDNALKKSRRTEPTSLFKNRGFASVKEELSFDSASDAVSTFDKSTASFQMSVDVLIDKPNIHVKDVSFINTGNTEQEEILKATKLEKKSHVKDSLPPKTVASSALRKTSAEIEVVDTASGTSNEINQSIAGNTEQELFASVEEMLRSAKLEKESSVKHNLPPKTVASSALRTKSTEMERVDIALGISNDIQQSLRSKREDHFQRCLPPKPATSSALSLTTEGIKMGNPAAQISQSMKHSKSNISSASPSERKKIMTKKAKSKTGMPEVGKKKHASFSSRRLLYIPSYLRDKEKRA